MSKKKLILNIIGFVAMISIVAFCGVSFSKHDINNHKRVRYYTPQITKPVSSKISKTKRITQIRTHFHATTFPSEIRGCYAKSIPYPNKRLSKYYQITSIIRITKNNIYQQFALTSKRLPMKKILVNKHLGYLKNSKERLHIKKLIKEHIPKSARSIVDNQHLRNRIGNYNIDMSPGNLHQNGNNLRYNLKMQTMLNGYNKKKLSKIIGNNKIIIIPPEFSGHIKMHAYENSYDMTFNGERFKRIENSTAKKYLRQSEIAEFFLGFK